MLAKDALQPLHRGCVGALSALAAPSSTGTAALASLPVIAASAAQHLIALFSIEPLGEGQDAAKPAVAHAVETTLAWLRKAVEALEPLTLAPLISNLCHQIATVALEPAVTHICKQPRDVIVAVDDCIDNIVGRLVVIRNLTEVSQGLCKEPVSTKPEPDAPMLNCDEAEESVLKSLYMLLAIRMPVLDEGSGFSMAELAIHFSDDVLRDRLLAAIVAELIDAAVANEVLIQRLRTTVSLLRLWGYSKLGSVAAAFTALAESSLQAAERVFVGMDSSGGTAPEAVRTSDVWWELLALCDRCGWYEEAVEMLLVDILGPFHSAAADSGPKTAINDRVTSALSSAPSPHREQVREKWHVVIT